MYHRICVAILCDHFAIIVANKRNWNNSHARNRNNQQANHGGGGRGHQGGRGQNKWNNRRRQNKV